VKIPQRHSFMVVVVAMLAKKLTYEHFTIFQAPAQWSSPHGSFLLTSLGRVHSTWNIEQIFEHLLCTRCVQSNQVQ